MPKEKIKVTRTEFKKCWAEFIAKQASDNMPIAAEICLLGAMFGSEFEKFIFNKHGYTPKEKSQRESADTIKKEEQ